MVSKFSFCQMRWTANLVIVKDATVSAQTKRQNKEASACCASLTSIDSLLIMMKNYNEQVNDLKQQVAKLQNDIKGKKFIHQFISRASNTICV